MHTLPQGCTGADIHINGVLLGPHPNPQLLPRRPRPRQSRRSRRSGLRPARTTRMGSPIRPLHLPSSGVSLSSCSPIFNIQYSILNPRIRLKRIYLLINASHGLKETDLAMLSHLNTQCTHALANGRPVTLQAIFTKCDLLLRKEGQKTLQRMQDEVFEAAPLCLPGIVTAASGGGGLVGVEKVRRSVVEACGLGRVSTPVVRRTSS